MTSCESTWNGTPVAVTGAGGFIGSHLVEALVQAGAQVRALASHTSGNEIDALQWVSPDVLAEIDIHIGDVRDVDAMERFVTDRAVVFHLAALVAIPYSYANPREVIDVNLNGTLNVALAARDRGVQRLVHTSTSEVYGTAQQVPITEDHPVNAQSPYAASKAAADQLVMSFGRSYDLPFTVVRPFNTYGPRQSMRAVLPTIAVQALAGGPIRLGALDTRRDMTFVADTVEGFMAAATTSEAEGMTLQLGTGTDYSVSEMVAAVERAMGRALVVEHDPRRDRPPSSEVIRLISNPGRMQSVTGWHPRWSFDDGVAQLVEWVGKNAETFHPDEYAI